MNTCDQCKWWIAPKDSDDHHNMGDCDNPKLECDDPEVQDCLFAGEVWSSGCRPSTGPKFGCVHWEAKT